MADLDDRTRHRLIGNGWHWGVARRLLLILVAFTTTGRATAEQPRPPPHLTTIQWVIDQLPQGTLPTRTCPGYVCLSTGYLFGYRANTARHGTLWVRKKNVVAGAFCKRGKATGL